MFEFYACGVFHRHISLFFLPSFPFLSYSGFSFFTFSSTCFCSKLVYNFSSAWLLLSLAKAGRPSTLLASLHTLTVRGPRSGHSSAPYFLKKRNKGVGAAVVSLLFEWVATWQFWLPLPTADCSWCGRVDVSQIWWLRMKLGLMAIALLPCTPGSVMLLPWQLQSAVQAQALHSCCYLSYLSAAHFSSLLACCKPRAFPPGFSPVSALQRDVAPVCGGPVRTAMPWWQRAFGCVSSWAGGFVHASVMA